MLACLSALLAHPQAEEGLTSLADYVARKKEGQTQIYYLAGWLQGCLVGSSGWRSGWLGWLSINGSAGLPPLLLLCSRQSGGFPLTRHCPASLLTCQLSTMLPLCRARCAADSRAACEASPYVEALTSKGYEVG